MKRTLTLRVVEQPRLTRIRRCPKLPQLTPRNRNLTLQVLLALIVVSKTLVVRRVKLGFLRCDLFLNHVVHLCVRAYDKASAFSPLEGK
jgi:hypothetical protein